MKLTEPTTTITDYLLAAETLFLGILLLRNQQLLPVKLWAFAFFFLSIAAVMGGTYHGFITSLKPSFAHGIWKITLYSIGAATLFMLSAVILSYVSEPWKSVFLVVAALQFFAYIYFMTRSDDFRYVIFNYAPAMAAILLLAIIHRNYWLVLAIVISFAGAAVQRSGIQLHKHLNFNDLYHFIQMIGMYFFYRGGKLL